MVGDDLGEIWFNTDTEPIDNQDRESQVSCTRSYTISGTHTYVAVKYNAVRYYRPFEISSEWARGRVCRNCKLYVHTTMRHQHSPESFSHRWSRLYSFINLRKVPPKGGAGNDRKWDLPCTCRGFSSVPNSAFYFQFLLSFLPYGLDSCSNHIKGLKLSLFM